jgi:hypothetical protein
MKINRFIALAAIALLVIGAMGFLSYKAFAQTNQPPASTDCNGQDDDAAEAVEAEDTDDVEEECGPQDENVDEAGEADTDNVENEAEDGKDANEASEAQGGDEADEVAPATTTVSADEAQAIVEAANPGTATLNVEFDRENGTDIWEVELDNGLDVKVDAGSGAILLTEGCD